MGNNWGGKGIEEDLGDEDYKYGTNEAENAHSQDISGFQ